MHVFQFNAAAYLFLLDDVHPFEVEQIANPCVILKLAFNLIATERFPAFRL